MDVWVAGIIVLDHNIHDMELKFALMDKYYFFTYKMQNSNKFSPN
jgi:hypothetical protein